MEGPRSEVESLVLITSGFGGVMREVDRTTENFLVVGIEDPLRVLSTSDSRVPGRNLMLV